MKSRYGSKKRCNKNVFYVLLLNIFAATKNYCFFFPKILTIHDDKFERAFY